ncbi:uncharacterized protein LOC133320728 [Danaus plexippus]|uniref:uncharacterized protein LOC133320728 n=1 Tax=Danaus plexippus TaxID=13037 RepID=UPI002AAF0C5C|nr:uncharacterized protein LOC133320728 [Danaus plexippus]
MKSSKKRKISEEREHSDTRDTKTENSSIIINDKDSSFIETSISSTSKSSSNFFSDFKFVDLPICDPIKNAITENLKLETLTAIQAKSIPYILKNKDILGSAKTGSGKTLSFLIPALDLMYKVKFLPRNGTGCLVITPTRELALQIYDVAVELSAFLPQTHGLIMGGVNRKQEAQKLQKGVNLLIATPGRLLDHLQTAAGFIYRNLLMLIIDEADRILEIGFEEDMTAILKLLPAKRQTLLFSATQTSKVSDLARLSLNSPVLVEVKNEVATVEGLEQGYVICAAKDRFQLLFTFLRKNRTKKIMVFFSSCMSVKFHNELFNYIDLPNLCIHGKKKQAARMSTYYEFCQQESGILLCTDVAARGLDIPNVDWIVQYDPPDDPKEYIHRVGRTARGANGKGQGLLFLMPEEILFLQFLKQANIPLTEYTFDIKRFSGIKDQLEKLIEKNYHLHRGSREAYRSYLHAYISHGLKDIFNVHHLDLNHVAASFGFANPPKIELNLRTVSSNRNNTMKKHKRYQTSGLKFSANNPHRIRQENNNRQFCY